MVKITDIDTMKCHFCPNLVDKNIVCLLNGRVIYCCWTCILEVGKELENLTITLDKKTFEHVYLIDEIMNEE